MFNFKRLLLLTLIILVYIPVFMLWGLNYLSIPLEVISVVHIPGGIISFFLLFTFVNHVLENKKLTEGGQLGWMLFIVIFGPISWLIYLLAYRKTFK